MTKPKQWDITLLKAKFIYNSAKNKTTGKTSLEIEIMYI